MCKHEDKACPRCHSTFACRVGDITKCQCNAVQLNDAERDFLARTYNDCLCAGCMEAVRTAWNQAQKEARLKKDGGMG